jgi:hypothetical protein
MNSEAEQLLSELQDAIEGRSTHTWRTWWKLRASTAEAALTRTEFLKLKFDRLEGAEAILRARGRCPTWSLSGRRLLAWSRLADDATDERGHPIPALRGRAYGGSLAALLAGDTKSGRSKVRRWVKRLIHPAAASSTAEQAEQVLEHAIDDLSELAFDAEALALEGREDAATEIATALVELVPDTDLTRPVLDVARRVAGRTPPSK